MAAKKSKRVRDSEQLLNQLVELMEAGDATVVEKEGNIVRRLRPTKIGQSRGKNDTIEYINNKLTNDRTIEELEQFLENSDFLKDKTKRRYRRKEDYPDPSKPSWAEVNRAPRSKKQINLRLDARVLALVEEAAEKSGLNRTSWMTAVFLRAAQGEGIEIPAALQPLLDDPSQEI